MKTRRILDLKQGRWLMTLGCLLLALSSFALTPSEAFSKASAKLRGATSLSADFSMTLNGSTVKGTIKSKGDKFAIISNVTSNWFDGKELYTLNPSKKQTTIFRPTKAELIEVNPLLYLQSASDYKISGTKTKKAGVETVVLIPKSSGSGVKNVVIDLDSKTLLPKTIKLTPTAGDAIVMNVSNIKLNGSIADADFKYPKSKYPNVTIVDMR
ncbi:MAG: outer membrane lipoprotein carrier protein LolA [Muribaculaceae bacterium]|nr:outer membrane lipoprotein carrier protein LolA [Muribaculaceae bacterium]